MYFRVFGTFYICYGNLGNGTGRGQAGFFSTLGAILTITLVNIVPYFIPVSKEIFFLNKLEQGYVGKFLVLTSMILGIIVIVIYIYHFLVPLIPKHIIHKHYLLELLFVRRSIRHDTSIKQSASFKVNRMISNAFKLHRIEDGYKTSLLKFVQNKEHEMIGGLKWVYKKAWDHSLFTEEGIWLSSRLKGCLMCNSIIVILILLYDIDFLNDIYDPLYDPLNDSYDYRKV